MTTPLRYRMRGDLQWQYTENPDQAAHAHEVQHLQPAHPWQKLTPELLADISQEGARPYWLHVKPDWGDQSGYVAVGEYEWQQGRKPDGFNTDKFGRIGAGYVTHVMVYTAPDAP